MYYEQSEKQPPPQPAYANMYTPSSNVVAAVGAAHAAGAAGRRLKRRLKRRQVALLVVGIKIAAAQSERVRPARECGCRVVRVRRLRRVAHARGPGASGTDLWRRPGSCG